MMLDVVLLTYQRTQYAIRTVQALKKHLSPSPRFYVADDGSAKEHLNAVLSVVGDDLIGYHTKKQGYGANANEAWNHVGDVSLWMEDDWELTQDWDLSPYVSLLGDEDIGMIRLGHMPINLDLESIGRYGRMYLDVKFNRQYAFSGNPSLRHKRFYHKWGDYPVGHNPRDRDWET